MASILDRDTVNAFCRHTHVAVAGAANGPLAGLAFGAKDIYDVAGARTGFGSPDWLARHPPATVTAPAVSRLLESGATLVGKTHTDEMTYSLAGENVHYGTPINVNASGRIPGGSSSGSAAATAAGLVDFALGSDTGGSVRGPASFCGLHGLRPSHGRIPLAGARPLAPSMDTCGWFARSAVLLEKVGGVLFGSRASNDGFARLLVAEDAFALADVGVREALAPGLRALLAALGTRETPVTLAADDLLAWADRFRVLQGWEVQETYGAYLRSEQPALGPGIAERFEWAMALREPDVVPLRARRREFTDRLESLLAGDGLLALPSMPCIAPLRGAPPAEMDAFRRRALAVLCPAGLAGLPQISLPLGTLSGCPLGLGLIGPRGADERLLALALRLEQA